MQAGRPRRAHPRPWLPEVNEERCKTLPPWLRAAEEETMGVVYGGDNEARARGICNFPSVG